MADYRLCSIHAEDGSASFGAVAATKRADLFSFHKMHGLDVDDFNFQVVI